LIILVDVSFVKLMLLFLARVLVSLLFLFL